MLESLLVPTAIVALAEIGDKTQLLALILAARFRKPWPIIAGIIAATLANHAAAGAVGAWVGSFFSDSALHWILAASFTATALWTLVPDKMDDDENPARRFERIVARAAVYRVVSCAAVDCIGALATPDRVIAGAAGQNGNERIRAGDRGRVLGDASQWLGELTRKATG